MNELLVFQLYGPLASWGETAVGEFRPSATHPGKSQIAGLLGAALGVTRDQEDDLNALSAGFGLAVCIDAEGELLRDYHTVQITPQEKKQRFHTRREELAGDNLYTILSRRDYRVEAAWICALWTYDGAPWTLSDFEQALKNPKLMLYLGRKACPPALPLNPCLIQADSLVEAFLKYQRDEKLLRLSMDTEQHRFFWEEPLPTGLKTGVEDKLWVTLRRDQPRSRTRWQFDTREEHHAIFNKITSS